jgi:hypothetical protein
MKKNAIPQTQQAAAWILKSLCNNRQWFDEIRLAGYQDFERKYNYIPLFDLSQASDKYDIRILKDACYLLRENNHVDIWGDDYEPYGMLVQVSSQGVIASNELFYGRESRTIARKAVGVFATLTTIIAIAIGINKTLMHKQKNQAPEYNKTKTTTDILPKATAFLK